MFHCIYTEQTVKMSAVHLQKLANYTVLHALFLGLTMCGLSLRADKRIDWLWQQWLTAGFNCSFYLATVVLWTTMRPSVI